MSQCASAIFIWRTSTEALYTNILHRSASLAPVRWIPIEISVYFIWAHRTRVVYFASGWRPPRGRQCLHSPSVLDLTKPRSRYPACYLDALGHETQQTVLHRSREKLRDFTLPHFFQISFAFLIILFRFFFEYFLRYRYVFSERRCGWKPIWNISEGLTEYVIKSFK